MNEARRTRIAAQGSLTLAGLLTGVMLFGTLPATAPARAQEALRPVVGKPLEKAVALARKGQYAAAMAQINVADAARGKTENESFVITEMRASVSQQAGDYKTAISSDEALLRSGKIGAAEQQKLLMAIASSAYQLRDYAQAVNAIQRYQKAGGTLATMQQLKIQCYYLLRDYAHAAAEQSAQIEAEIRARQVPPEQQLQLLASCQLQTNDQAGLSRTMVHLVTYYPKPDYWAQLVHGLRADPNVPERLQFDIDRLRLDVGLLTSTSDYMDMTELAVQAGLPAQALAVMNKGYASGALGRDPQAPREARLKALVEQTVASKKASLAADEATARKDDTGNGLVAAGYSAVDLGQAQQGIAMMRDGIAKGGLAAPNEATLHLGLAYLGAGDKPGAIRTLQSLSGNTPEAELAGLWLLRIGKA